MKQLFIFLIMISMLSLGLNCVRIDELKDAELDVRETMDSFYKAVEAQDLEGILSFYLLKEGTVMLGTDVNDRYAGRVEIEQKWSEMMDKVESLDIFKSDETIQISSDLKTAWISSVNRVEEENREGQFICTLFFSAVLENRAGNWVFRQMHFSIPKETKKEDSSVTAKPDSVINEFQLKVKKLERDTTSLETKQDSIKTSGLTEDRDY